MTTTIEQRTMQTTYAVCTVLFVLVLAGSLVDDGVISREEGTRGACITLLAFFIGWLIFNEFNAAKTKHAINVALRDSKTMDHTTLNLPEGRLAHVKCFAPSIAVPIGDYEFNLYVHNAAVLVRNIQVFGQQCTHITHRTVYVGGKKVVVDQVHTKGAWQRRRCATGINELTIAADVYVGAYVLPKDLLVQACELTPLSLDPSVVFYRPSADSTNEYPAIVLPNCVYFGRDPTNPALGDVRVSFQVGFLPNVITLASSPFPALRTFKPYTSTDGHKVHIAAAGEHSMYGLVQKVFGRQAYWSRWIRVICIAAIFCSSALLSGSCTFGLCMVAIASIPPLLFSLK